jgi:hypothetical protein
MKITRKAKNTYKKFVVAKLIVFMAFAFMPGVGFAHSDASLQETVELTTHFPTVSSSGRSARLTGFLENNSDKELLTWFNWGDTTEMRQRTSTRKVSTSNRLREYSKSVSGLVSGRWYYFQIAVQDIEGNKKTGKTIRFRSDGRVEEYAQSAGAGFTGFTQTQVAPPIVFSSGATSITLSSATLSGTVLPRGNFYTNGYFEWGETTALGNKTLTRGIGLDQTIEFSEKITGLKPYTQYFYRTVAQNQNGSNWGEIQTFVSGVTNSGISPIIKPVVNNTYVAPPVASTEASTPSNTTSKTTDSESNEPKKSSPMPNLSFGALFERSSEEDTSSSTNEYTNSQEERDAQVAALALNNSDDNGRGFFPKTFVGWVLLAILIVIFVGLLVHITNLHEQVKVMRKRQENNGNGSLPKSILF